MKFNQSSGGKVFKMITKVLSWVLFAILSIAALFLLYYFISTKIYAAKGPGYEPKFSIYTIASGSMTPTIKVYDTIINVKVNKPEDLEVGDVITFISTSLLTPGTTITHRIIGISTDENGVVCYQTKGDFNPIADQSCAKFHNIIGKVVFKIPQLGRVQYFLASRAGWLFCILIPALFIISKDVLKITKLSGIKSTAEKITADKKKDPKKEKEEQKRKEELKQKLKLEDNSQEYEEEIIVKTIDKRKNKEQVSLNVKEPKNKKKSKNTKNS